MLKQKVNHCDTITESAVNSTHSATVQVGDLLGWIRGADSKNFKRTWEPKTESVTNQS